MILGNKDLILHAKNSLPRTKFQQKRINFLSVLFFSWPWYCKGNHNGAGGVWSNHQKLGFWKYRSGFSFAPEKPSLTPCGTIYRAWNEKIGGQSIYQKKACPNLLLNKKTSTTCVEISYFPTFLGPVATLTRLFLSFFQKKFVTASQSSEVSRKKELGNIKVSGAPRRIYIQGVTKTIS